jgi:hypothetical protein
VQHVKAQAFFFIHSIYNIMKSSSMILLLSAVLLFFSCKKDDSGPDTFDELDGLLKVTELDATDYAVEIFSSNGQFLLGHNYVFMRFREKASGNYLTEVEANWLPMMRMTMHSHSAPYSSIEKIPGKTALFGGEIVFQMPGNDSESWDLKVMFKVDDNTYSAQSDILVANSPNRRLITFTGTDSARYIMAMGAPVSPKVAMNDLVIGIYKRESMMLFPKVEGFRVVFDPRMPDMGNHSSPNNQQPVFNSATGYYQGKIALTMTGYWRINLMLFNDSDERIGGEAISSETEGSSLYFDLDF